MAASAFFSALFAGVLATFTWRLIVVGRDQHRAAMDAIEVAKVNAGIASLNARAAQVSADTANKLARDALISDQRPWIAVDIRITAPITWDGNGCNFRFEFILTNSGKTPALDVRIDMELYSSFGFDAAERQRAFSETHSSIKDRFMGATIFPGKSVTYDMRTTISNEQIETVRKRLKESRGIDMDFLDPTLIGCASYAFVFGDERHQTGFIAEIRRVVAVNNSVAINRAAGDIPIHHLSFTRGIKDGYTD